MIIQIFGKNIESLRLPWTGNYGLLTKQVLIVII